MTAKLQLIVTDTYEQEDPLQQEIDALREDFAKLAEDCQPITYALTSRIEQDAIRFFLDSQEPSKDTTYGTTHELTSIPRSNNTNTFLHLNGEYIGINPGRNDKGLSSLHTIQQTIDALMNDEVTAAQSARRITGRQQLLTYHQLTPETMTPQIPPIPNEKTYDPTQ